MDFLKCRAEEEDEKRIKLVDASLKPCKPVLEDYLECLHHTKERELDLLVRREAKRQQEAGTAVKAHH